MATSFMVTVFNSMAYREFVRCFFKEFAAGCKGKRYLEWLDNHTVGYDDYDTNLTRKIAFIATDEPTYYGIWTALAAMVENGYFTMDPVLTTDGDGTTIWVYDNGIYRVENLKTVTAKMEVNE